MIEYCKFFIYLFIYFLIIIFFYNKYIPVYVWFFFHSCLVLHSTWLSIPMLMLVHQGTTNLALWNLLIY